MDSAISIHPITSSQLLSVCNYITSFGIFLNNLGLINIDERNQTVPVLNSLYEYLNRFDNQSEPKIQLLRKLFNETVHSRSGENETVTDIKIVEKHYRYFINAALFSHYGYITGYLAEIINKTETITPLILKQKVFQHLTDSYINNDRCSLVKGSSKLTLLAIEPIFVDYILPIFSETWTLGRNLAEGQKNYFQVLQRPKRQPNEDTDNILVSDDSPEEWIDISDARFINWIENNQNMLKNSEENAILVNDSDENNHDDSSNDSSWIGNNEREFEDIEEKELLIDDSDFLFDSSNIPNDISRVDNSGGSESVNVFDEVQEREKTERLQAIETAANIMYSSDCKTFREDFLKSLSLLKCYILKLGQQDSDTSNVPTYDMLAKDYCSNNSHILGSYEEWKINEKYVDDVLFKTKFDVPKDTRFFLTHGRRRPFSYEVFEYYKSNLPVLQKSIRFEDFYSIWKALGRYNFFPTNVKQEGRNQILAAIHRLALRQCDEENINNKQLTLFVAKMVKNNVYKNYVKKFDIKLNKFTRFSLFRNVEVNHLETQQNKLEKGVLYQIQLRESVCGVLDLKRIIPVEEGSHILLIDMIFALNSVQYEIFNNQTVAVLTLIPLEYVPKENSMVKIVEGINKILPSVTNFYIN